MTLFLVSIIIPVFNENDSILPFLQKIQDVLKITQYTYFEYIFVNDGSQDKTLETLLHAQKNTDQITIIDLSRNFGKEAALSAGIEHAKGDAIIPIDVDFQDPPELIPLMIERWRQGYEVVLAKRVDRTNDTWLKRSISSKFYRFHNLISDTKIPENVGDFRLMDRCVVDALKALPESQRFMKGLFSWVGFKTVSLEYKRPKRLSGATKFRWWKLWNLALEGVTSFSTIPLKAWTYVGLFISSISFFYAFFIFFRVLFFGIDIPGYSSLIVTITFLGGMQLLSSGILGEYLGRTYLESKRRPPFIVRKIYRKK